MSPLQTTRVVPPVTANPHLARLGGEAAVVRLVDAFYAAMHTREDARAIRALHASDLSTTKAVLVSYLVEWLGGPKRYSAERGAPRLGRVHRPFGLDAAAADAWLACMDQALAATCADGALREQLMAAFTKVARHLTSPHASLPPQPRSPR
jgi:hemoglobin